MKIIALSIVLMFAACADQPSTGEGQTSGYLSVDVTSVTIKLVGHEIDEIVVKATMTGPHVDGAPIAVPFSELQDANFDDLADLRLTAGDETWNGPSITLVDDGTPVEPLRVMCGRTANLQIAIGGEVSDPYWDAHTGTPASHFESSTTEVDGVAITCS